MTKKIKTGVLGLGRAGHTMHVPELKGYPDFYDVIAGCDNDEERRTEAAADFPEMKIYADVNEFLQDPDIELVTVATRSPMHVDHSIAALRAGKYVVIEKPICVRYADALRLAETVKQYPGKLFVRHNRRFEPAFSHIREILDSGILGTIYEIKLRRHSFQWRSDWQTIDAEGGGQLLNWGPHIVDHSLRLLGSPVKSIWSDLKLVAARGDAEDHLKIIFTGENGRIVDMEISGGAAISEPVYVIHGTRGSLICQDETRIHLRYINPNCPKPNFPASAANPPLKGGYGAAQNPDWVEDDLGVAPRSGDHFTKMWEYIYYAIREGRPYPVKFQEAMEVARVLDLVKQGPVQNVRDL